MRFRDGRLWLAASDFTNFLACRHLTRLDAAAAYGLVRAPKYRDVGAQTLEERGIEHETRVLEGFRSRGWTIADLRTASDDRREDAEATVEAMRAGVDLIYQGTLLVGDRMGLPDFLVRANLMDSREEDSLRYEVVDAKLARTAKARAVLQTTWYSALVGELLGRVPEYMHLALGDNEIHRLRVADYAAYGRQLDRLMVGFAAAANPVFPPADTYPEPVEHCAICRWRVPCQQRRRDDDDLSLIASITARQRKVLKASGISTRRGFAALVEVPQFDHVSPQGIARAQAQARLQVQGEDRGLLLWEFVDPGRTEDETLAANRGLTALPPRSPGDLFFDIEGARYYSEDGIEYGLQYLFGIVDTAELDDHGRPNYHEFWSFDRKDEKRAFEQVVDFIVDRRTRNPDLHVYHYNHYEPTALDHLSELHETREDIIGRLMGRFATREDEVDHLLRRRVFVDLYRVVRQGIRASVESYSLKRIEGLYGFRREIGLDEVDERMLGFERALDDSTARENVENQRVIAGYNADDCRATLELRNWLEDRRSDLAASLGVDEIPRPVASDETERTIEPEFQALIGSLIAGIPDEERTPEQEARSLMADLLDWHRRDSKPGWWRFFRLQDLTDEELLAEPDAIGTLELVGTIAEHQRSIIVRYRFPAQEHPFRPGDQAVDPHSGKQWMIYDIDDAAGCLDIRRGRDNMSPHPSALIESGPIDTSSHRARLRDLAAQVAAIGNAAWTSGPEFDLLLRRPPNVGAGDHWTLRRDGEDVVEAGRRLAVALADSCLAVQGPPGSGKTFTGAKQIVDLVRAGRRVGVTANSHAVIRNLLNEVALQNELGRPLLIGQKPDSAEIFASPHATVYRQAPRLLGALSSGDAEVVGGTTWLWTREDFRDSVDVLVVDEAGQMSLANALGAAQAAPNLILLGDPQQLGQPSAAAHPPGSDISALERVLGEHVTMPEDIGLFIEHTRRMHPDVCAFTSEVFYEGRLASLEELRNQSVLGPGRFTGAGLRILDIVHDGNDDSSPEEAQVVAELVAELCAQQWQKADLSVDTIGLEGILVVTPFNAQIHEIQEALRARGILGARVGTVDKFQGQQAPVVIYSMASSTAEDAPRGMEFLYDLRRLNVATSRARCLAILVSSPELVRVFCRTPRQIVLANALCRFREMAEGTG